MVKVWEILADEPREANTEGGLFPAIIGTVMMVLLTSIIVIPFGVITALYLGEYARQGVIVKIVRIAINNLAGVPQQAAGAVRRIREGFRKKERIHRSANRIDKESEPEYSKHD